MLGFVKCPLPDKKRSLKCYSYLEHSRLPIRKKGVYLFLCSLAVPLSVLGLIPGARDLITTNTENTIIACT